jgi:hypothetical protein
MTKQADQMIDHRPRLYNATVQNRRCWALLKHIIGKETVINAPAITKVRANGKSEA